MKESFLLDPYRELRSGESDENIPIDCIFVDGMTYNDGKQYYLLLSADEYDEWGVLSLKIEGAMPTPNSSLAFEIAAIGCIEEVLDIKNVETFLLQNGIAPGQRFWMRVSIKYFYSYLEWDADIDYTVTSIIPWSIERAATAWEAFNGRKLMMVFSY